LTVIDRTVFYSPGKIQAAHELQKEEQQAKEATIALKAEEKLQRQLQKEGKRRLVEQRKAQRVQDKLQRQKEAEARKLAAQEAKQAKQAERQLRSNIKQARQLKKSQNNIILGTEEVDLEAVDGAEAQVALKWLLRLHAPSGQKSCQQSCKTVNYSRAC